MKKILYIIGAAAMMFASCTKELENELQTGIQDVVLSVSPDFSYGDGTIEPMSAMTRAGGTVAVNNYILEMYDNAEYSGTPTRHTNTNGEFALTLDRTKDYYALLWADNDKTVYKTDNLKEVTLNDDIKPIEAFFGKATISGANPTLKVTLKRATAKINLCDKNGMEAGTKVNLKYSHYPMFSAVVGSITGTPLNEDYDITSVASVADGAFGSFWLLAPTTASSKFDLTFQVTGEATPTEVTDITYQANHRTNVKGQYVEPPTPAKVGDYYYSDGTYSTTLNTSKTCVGIVFWLGDPTVNDEALKAAHPKCTNGLIVALNDADANTVTWQLAYSTYNNTVNSWTTTNATQYAPIISGNGANDPINKIMGYNNTKAIEAFNADAANSGWKVEAVEKVVAYRTAVPAPSNTSGWYLPSTKELALLCGTGDPNGNIYDDGYGTDNRDAMNAKLTNDIGATQIQSDYYWSSSELDDFNAWFVYFGNGYTNLADKDNDLRVRAVSAF